MSKPDTTYSAEVERVVHAAVASAMTDFAALLLAYGRKGLLLRYIAHAQEQVLTVLKNASAGSMPLELQATAFTRAVVVGVTTLIDNAIRRDRVPFQGIPDQ